MSATHQRIVLASRPKGVVTPENFRLEQVPTPQPGPGEVLVRNHYLSLDPYMRGRMEESKSYAEPQKIGETMIGGTVGVVEISNHAGLVAGDTVVGAARLAGIWRRQRPAADESRHPGRADVGLPRSGRHAGRDGVVRAQSHLRAEARRDGAGIGSQRRRRQRRGPACEAGGLPRDRHRWRAGQVRVRGRRSSASMRASTTGSSPT